MARYSAPVPYPDYVPNASICTDARTFPELFGTYSMQWPDAALDAIHSRWESIEHYGEHLLRIAHAVAAEFPGIDLWDGHREDNSLLEEVLRGSMRKFKPSRGTFDRLFERNLRERLRREAAREARRAARRSRQEREAALAAQCIRARGNGAEAARRRWAVRLLDLAVERLDDQTQIYLRMSLGGSSTKDIALALNMDERSVLNRYSGDKLSRRVQRAVRRLVLELPERHRQLLMRHLLDEVGLTPDMVEALLRVPVSVENTVPVLEEEALLTLLGWSENFEESAATSGADGSMYGEPKLGAADQIPPIPLPASA